MGKERQGRCGDVPQFAVLMTYKVSWIEHKRDPEPVFTGVCCLSHAHPLSTAAIQALIQKGKFFLVKVLEHTSKDMGVLFYGV